MGTVRREPIETAGRGVAVACVRSGISGWVIGLLIGWRAVAERRAANPGRLVADAGRRRGPPLFSVWDLEIGGGGALRQQPLATAGRRAAFGCARTLLDFGIGRARPLLESARKRGPRYTFAARFLVRARAAPRPAVSIRRRRRAAMGTVRREPIETAGRGVAVACVRSGISGWVIGLLIGGRAVAERRAANPGRLVADAGRRRGPPLFSVWDLEIGGGGALRQQPLATAGRRAAFGCARTLLDFGIGRARPLLESARKRGPRYTFAARFLVRARAAPRPAVSIRRRRRAAMGTVRREPIETAGRGVAVACVRSGISGWVIGLLIRGRAGAERRAANPGRLVADAGRRRGPPLFSVWDLEIGGGGALRQQPLATAGRRAAFGCARTLLDFGIGRARPLLESARKRGPRYTFAARFLVRARAAPRPAVSIRRRRRAAMGTVRREPIETAGRGVAVACVRSGISGWVIGLLIRGRAVAERRAANPGRLVADAGRRRGPPLFSVWDLEIGGGGALRQQPLATAGRRAAFGCARTLLDFGIGRARPLLESARKGGRVNLCCAFPRAREGGASASGFDPAAPARSYGDCSARADRNRWPRGGCGVCALWHFRLGDRALDRWACGRRTARGQSWSPGCWPTARPAAVFCLGLGDRRWRSSSPTAARNSWPQGSLRMCSHAVGFWHWPSATAP